MITAVDEGRHPPGPEELWGESWYLDFAAPDGAYGGYVRLGLYPNLGVTWYWLHLVGDGRPLVFVREHALPCPDGDDALAPDARGIRAALSTPEPLTRVHVATEATAVRLADPADVFRGEHGDAVPVRLDLEWSARGPVYPYSMTTRYEQSAWVTGELEIGGERIAVDCPGQRDHSWGVRDWWLFPWNWTSGRLDDGTWFHAARSIIPGVELFQAGYVLDSAGTLTEIDGCEVDVEVDDELLPTGARQRIGPLRLSTMPIAHAPVLLVAPDGRETRFQRAMCRFTTDDGRVGSGWTEYNWPPGFPRRG